MSMSQIHAQKMAAEMDGEFVVFLIGMRINKPWKIHKWLPVFLAMPRMLKELAAHPEIGFLGHVMSLGVIVHTGAHLKISKPMLAATITHTGRPGWPSTSACK